MLDMGNLAVGPASFFTRIESLGFWQLILTLDISASAIIAIIQRARILHIFFSEQWPTILPTETEKEGMLYSVAMHTVCTATPRERLVAMHIIRGANLGVYLAEMLITRASIQKNCRMAKLMSTRN